MSNPAFLRALASGWGLLALLLMMSACTVPQAAYRKVDQNSPAFKQAVAVETERQQTLGQSPSKAEKTATRVVTRQIIQEEKVKRTRQIVPLVEILDAYDKPRGCWAYTATTTARKDGKSSVTVERMTLTNRKNASGHCSAVTGWLRTTMRRPAIGKSASAPGKNPSPGPSRDEREAS